MIDEPPVECFHTGRPARQNGNKGKITIPILGLGSHTPHPPNAPMPGVCFAQRPQMRSGQETRFLLPVAALSVETREISEQKGTSQGNSGRRALCKLVLWSGNPQLQSFSSQN